MLRGNPPEGVEVRGEASVYRMSKRFFGDVRMLAGRMQGLVRTDGLSHSGQRQGRAGKGCTRERSGYLGKAADRALRLHETAKRE